MSTRYYTVLQAHLCQSEEQAEPGILGLYRTYDEAREALRWQLFWHEGYDEGSLAAAEDAERERVERMVDNHLAEVDDPESDHMLYLENDSYWITSIAAPEA